MKQLPDEYELSEQDIDKMLNWLRVFDPANAVPEHAIKFLIYMREYVHDKFQHEGPESAAQLEPIYKKFMAGGDKEA